MVAPSHTFVGMAADPTGEPGMVIYRSDTKKLRIFTDTWIDVGDEGPARRVRRA